MEKFKKYILLSLLFLVYISLFYVSINTYNKYMINYNESINSIVNTVLDKYPLVDETQLISILNSRDINKNKDIFSKYGIDYKNEDIINKNTIVRRNSMTIIFILFIVSNIILVLLFLLYKKRRDKYIDNTIKYIEEINRKNYSLKMDKMDDHNLSKLMNEVYKMMIMLREDADNSYKDKMKIKDTLSDISHQLKTPLTSISIILDNLIDDKDMSDIDRDAFLRDIKRECININFLIISILKLAKLETNTIIFKKEKVNIRDIINKSVKNIELISEVKDIKINLDIKDSTVNVSGRWMCEAFSNIIKNCCEYSNYGGVIDITSCEFDLYTEVKIKDYGIGIKQEDIDKIFKRFYKLEDSLSDSIGIGLSLAKSIIDGNNGIILVNSEYGVGTEFIIRLFK